MTKQVFNLCIKGDVRLFKFQDAKMPIQELYGETWATAYQTEKNILDLIIAGTVSKVRGSLAFLSTFVVSREQIVEMFGLSVKHDSELFSFDEKQFLQRTHLEYLNEIKAFKVPVIDSAKSLTDFSTSIERLLKLGRPYKAAVQNNLDQRLKYLYSGTRSEVSKKKKMPLKDLISSVRQTREYIHLFQPNHLMGVVPFRCSKFPETAQEITAYKLQVTTWAGAIRPSTPELNVCSSWLSAAADF